MALPIQIISLHPLAAKSLVGFICSDRRLSKLVSLPAITRLEKLPAHRQPYLFVLDCFTLPLELSTLVRLLRIRYPRSKFLALVPSVSGNRDEMLRMLHNGIEGIEILSERLEEVMTPAIQAILAGEYWAPEAVLVEYRYQTKILLDQQLLPQLSLTGRETQVFQLMIRRLSNKEIAGAIGIAERTVRFHVSKVFAKLRVEDRRSLLSALDNLRVKPALLPFEHLE